MKTMMLACVAAGCLTTFAVAAAAESPTGPSAKAGQHRDPMQSSAAMTAGETLPVRYDSHCRAQFGFGSNGYTACLQRLPATALIGGR
jgi:hypothetical protein